MWHCDGDRNISFFHRTEKIKQAYKKIYSIRVNDEVITDQSHIANQMVSHFTNLFTSNNSVHDNGLIEEVIPTTVTDNINNLLTLMLSIAEIKNAVF
jgi:hypothetical protein